VLIFIHPISLDDTYFLFNPTAIFYGRKSSLVTLLSPPPRIPNKCSQKKVNKKMISPLIIKFI